MMNNKKFEYKVNLVPLSIDNDEQNAFRDNLNAIPYLVYEVEQISDGTKIVINKPGGKRNFGRLSRDDFMVFIYNPFDNSLWLISHKEILEDLELKFRTDEIKTRNLISLLYKVCCGEEPSKVHYDNNMIGILPETILKAYKWIWGQEDCNYPKKEGRWLSMNGILQHFNINREEL